MYKINKLQHGKHFVRDFHMHSVKDQKSHSFAALTRSISGTSPTCVKIPYALAFHEIISISLFKSFGKDLQECYEYVTRGSIKFARIVLLKECHINVFRHYCHHHHHNHSSLCSLQM